MIEARWQSYKPELYAKLDKEFWDAWLRLSQGDSSAVLHLGVLRLRDKWCAYASVPSKFDRPVVSHGGASDFVFISRVEAIAEAERLGQQAADSWRRER